jgi:hypothetical protein
MERKVRHQKLRIKDNYRTVAVRGAVRMKEVISHMLCVDTSGAEAARAHKGCSGVLLELPCYS